MTRPCRTPLREKIAHERKTGLSAITLATAEGLSLVHAGVVSAFAPRTRRYGRQVIAIMSAFRAEDGGSLPTGRQGFRS